MKTIITGLLIFLFTTSLYATDSYLCIAEQSAGFKFNHQTKQWAGVASTNINKYIVKKSKDKKYSWIVSEHGKIDSNIECKHDFNPFGYLTCGEANKFEMNKQTLRFRYESLVGYVVHNSYLAKHKEGDNEPHIIIGKCSVL